MSVTAEEILALWDKISPVSYPDFIQVSSSFVRAYRKRMRNGERWVTISEEQRVELGIPVGSEKRYWINSDHCAVDRRCLRRYKRKAKRFQ